MKYLPLILGISFFFGAFRAANAQGCHSPYARFTYTVATDGFTVSFTAQACDPALVYSWDFGDGAFSSYTENRKEVNHIYGSDDVYVVTMRVKNRCEEVYPQVMVIRITAGQPATMALTLTGPTNAAECQQLAYQANITGGVPPYTYSWKFDQHYCSGCSGAQCSMPGDTILPSERSPTVRLSLAGAGVSTIGVTVTDGQGRTASKELNVQVKAALTALGINAAAAQKSPGVFSTRSDIVFGPDITPLFTLDYPISYFWNFGDGEVHDDRYNGGGVWVHQYAQPGNYLVTLSVCDSNGCMEAVKKLQVSNSEKATGPQLEIIGQPNVATWVMAYNARTGRPSAATVQMVQSGDCASAGVYDWTATLSPDLGLTNSVLFSQRRELCGSALDQSMRIELSPTAPSKCWSDLLSKDHKPWGFVGLSCTKTCADSVGSSSATNDRLVYIQPDELEIGDFRVEGSCGDYIVASTIHGGAWKKTGQDFGYRQIVWQAFDSYDQDKELTDVFIDIPGEPDKKKINLANPYFKKFGPHQFVEFIVELRVQDYANGSVETNNLVAFNPFRVYLEDHYERCPGVLSPFSQDPLASGGSEIFDYNKDPYTFIWSSNTLSGPNPSFPAPAAGDTAIYSVTVTDRTGCSISKATTVTTGPLTLDLLPTRSACVLQGSWLIRPADIAPTGGSGLYNYKWFPEKYLSTVDSLNPAVVGLPAGQSITYTLTVQDVLGGCTVTDKTVVTGVANDLSLSIAHLPPICYGTATELKAYAKSASLEPVTDQYHWETNNRYHDVSTQSGSTLPISGLVSSYPGTYQYKVRYTNSTNGCYAEAEKTVVVRENWKHTGYVPGVRSAVVGAHAELWSSGKSNHILSANLPNKDNLQIAWSPVNPTSKVFVNGTQLPANGKFIPSAAAPYLTMQVRDNTTGCSQEYPSQRYVLVDEKPTLRVTVDKSPDKDADGTVCFEIYLDAHVSYVSSLLPTAVDLAYHITADISGGIQTGSLKLLLENSSGSYHGQVCSTFPTRSAMPYSRYLFDISALTTSFWDIAPATYEVYLMPHTMQPATAYPFVAPGNSGSVNGAQNITLEVFPNPFSDQVAIRYTLPSDCAGEVALY
ncbi:MAG: PKD domain-containing protein, partial [Saprospiraceae bacterium]